MSDLADCGHPCAPLHRRRGLCVSCYRKLSKANALPPSEGPGPRPRHPLRRWLESLDNAMLLKLKGWIEELAP